MLLVIPGIISYVSVSFALFILVAENLRGLEALRKSRKYVEGYWWDVFKRLLLIILASVGLLIGPLLGILDVPSSREIGELLGGFVSLILTPLVTIYSFLIYADLKRIKEQMG